MKKVVINIGLSEELKRGIDLNEAVWNELKDHILEYLVDFMNYFNIMAEVVSDAGSQGNGKDQSRHTSGLYQLEINGQKCRLPYFRHFKEKITIKCLATEIVKDIYYNREHIFGAGIPDGGKKDRTSIIVAICQEFETTKSLAGEEKLTQAMNRLRSDIFYETGVNLPLIRIEIDPKLALNEFRFEINGLKHIPLKGLGQSQFLVDAKHDRLGLLNVKGEMALNPENGKECTLIQSTDQNLEVCKAAGFKVWGRTGYIELHLRSEIMRKIAAFFTRGVFRERIKLLKTKYPDLVDTVTGRYNPDQLNDILKDLLNESLSVRDLRTIFESLANLSGTTKVDLNKYIVFFPDTEHLCPVAGNKKTDDPEVADFSNYIRISNKRYITDKYTKWGSTMVVYLLSPEIEERLNEILNKPLTGEETLKLHEAIAREIPTVPPFAVETIILTTIHVRRRLWELIRKEFPGVAVLSYNELSPDVNIQPIARIGWILN